MRCSDQLAPDVRRQRAYRRIQALLCGQVISPSHIPPMCGFNLLEKFSWASEYPKGRPFQEWDFDFMARHGFTFARLPMDYRCWTAEMGNSRRQIDMAALDDIAAAVEMGNRRGIHVCVNIHRGPGYCVNNPQSEPYNLWTDPAAQQDFASHWAALARRLADYSNRQCSFDLINEPPGYGQRGFTPRTHRQVMGLAARAIRDVTPERLIICDGHDCGNSPSPELIDLGVAQSMRGYIPFLVTHYQAPWCKVPLGLWPRPHWPLTGRRLVDWITGGPCDKAGLDSKVYQPWRDLQSRGVGVHCGEMGVYNKTPPEVTYAFLEDLLSIMNANGWGWALWNLRGPFGVLDNGRDGAAVEICDGHELDVGMLELLKRHLPGP
jgi:endoglucanase